MTRFVSFVAALLLAALGGQSVAGVEAFREAAGAVEQTLPLLDAMPDAAPDAMPTPDALPDASPVPAAERVGETMPEGENGPDGFADAWPWLDALAASPERVSARPPAVARLGRPPVPPPEG